MVGVAGPGDVDAHVSVGGVGGLAAEGQAPPLSWHVVRQEEVAPALEADRALAPGQQQGGVHALGVPQADQVSQGVAPVDPDAVDVGDEDRIVAEQGAGLLQAAAGFQQFGALVGDADRRAGAAGQMVFQPVGEPVDVDHGVGDARVGQPVEDVVDQRLAADFDQGLGPVVRQGPHPRAEPGSEDHGGGGCGHARSPILLSSGEKAACGA
ncbi:hypothetical protein D3C80_1131130 [compost metagenome]